MDFAVPDAAGIIQLALTPVFLLAGTAAFLNVFATRLARVSDRVNSLFETMAGVDNPDAARILHLYYLRKRTLALELAVVLATFSGVCTCLATLGLLTGAIRHAYRDFLLVGFFGIAVASLIGALGAFLVEMIVAGRSMLRQIANDRAHLERRHHRTYPSSAGPDGG
ncbi:DUF2721 domain-containing protein [Rhizobium sp. BK251]|uniref:DUF2721 domain-containing protein n=1 Tax=Rhizobium sp. BK251 TaxID=2512125 RepID=UPI00104B3699|nr:DUF2721 domain-containing protein [Rhizobium sp. BK251]TCL72150.1 uncharacterized protein DUF2721 [Rhizobium sp. BK251]